MIKPFLKNFFQKVSKWTMESNNPLDKTINEIIKKGKFLYDANGTIVGRSINDDPNHPFSWKFTFNNHDHIKGIEFGENPEDPNNFNYVCDSNKRPIGKLFFNRKFTDELIYTPIGFYDTLIISGIMRQVRKKGRSHIV